MGYLVCVTSRAGNEDPTTAASSMTAGTVMRGGMRVGDTLELPELRQQKKIKSMQMFRWAAGNAAVGSSGTCQLAACGSRERSRACGCSGGVELALAAASIPVLARPERERCHLLCSGRVLTACAAGPHCDNAAPRPQPQAGSQCRPAGEETGWAFV